MAGETVPCWLRAMAASPVSRAFFVAEFTRKIKGRPASGIPSFYTVCHLSFVCHDLLDPIVLFQQHGLTA
jgi:hypothetical protein